MPDNCDYSDSPQAATSWLVGGLKSAYCGWSASYSTQPELPEIKIKKNMVENM